MRPRSVIGRPSPALIVASLALFVSLGGAGYAAIAIPDYSVGANQLRRNAVTNTKLAPLSVGFRKIQLGAVGTRRINNNQVQERVNGACAVNSAVASIDNLGNVQCAATSPKEYGSLLGPSVPLTTGSATIATLPLPAGSSHLVFASARVDAVNTPPGSQIKVQCTLSTVPGDTSTTITRSVTFQDGAQPQIASIPLILPAPAAVHGSVALVACTKNATGSAATASVSTSINAIQTASNG